MKNKFNKGDTFVH